MEIERLDKLFGPPLNSPKTANNLWKYAAITFGLAVFYFILKKANKTVKEKSSVKFKT